MQSSLATQAEKGVGAVSRAHQVLLKAPACFIFHSQLMGATAAAFCMWGSYDSCLPKAN